MRYAIALVVGTCLTIGMSAAAWTASQQPTPVSVASTSIDEVLVAVRADLQERRSDILAKNLTLTSAQAAKFWPMFETYQTEQNAIMDEQLKGIQQYIEGFDTADDAGALALMNAHLDRDARMSALRKKWLGQFQKAVGTKLAVRAMQIDRRLGLAHQIEYTSRIPLAH